MIGGRRVLAGEDRVADLARRRGEHAGRRLRARTAGRRGASALAESSRQQCGVVARRSGSSGEAAAGAGIGGRGIAVRRGQRLRRCRRGCRSRDRRDPRARRSFERRGICRACARDWTKTGSSQSSPSQRRSSKMPSTNSGRLRVWSRSSIRSRKRPPLSRAACMAERARYTHGRDAAARSATARNGSSTFAAVAQRTLDRESLKMLS